ncbi:MAG: N-6 DNA methylase [Proteobacteria bacterium]|nr:N-6 DNA methylase [Pseudomonadota bacterium]
MLDQLAPQERAMLVHRWQELASVRDLPWAREALTSDPVGGALSVDLSQPARGDWDRVRDGHKKTALGQVFTPPRMARALAETLPGIPARVLDPACGDGSLLAAAADMMVARGLSPTDALSRLEGWDRDPHAAWLARARLIEWSAAHGGAGVPCIRVVDALEAEPVKPVDAMIANPPYLEAKRMRGAAPGLREQLAARYPQLTGAWDLYVVFLLRAAELLSKNGSAAFLVPNKILQARYGRHLRAQWIGATEGPLRIEGVVDCAMLTPRPFPGTSVYPVLLRLRRGDVDFYQARRAATWDQLEQSDPQVVTHNTVQSVGGEHPIFVPFNGWQALEECFNLGRLEGIAKVASTCSFHKKGLRELFVTSEKPEAYAWPYLGGKSRARRTEVSCFAVDWRGYWISYDQEALRTTHQNPLPKLQVFARPKAILCQHALRVRAYADHDGTYVTKDVYPVAWPVDPAWSLDALVTLLNSTVFTALYNTLFQGVRVSGETYHYLPAFLHQVPVPDRAHGALAGLEPLARPLASGGFTAELWDAADRAIAEAYGVTPGALDRLREVYLRRVGAQTPG